MRKEERKNENIKVLNDSKNIVTNEQEVKKDWKRFWGKPYCTNGTAVLGIRRDMNGNGMSSGGQLFSLQKMSYALHRIKRSA